MLKGWSKKQGYTLLQVLCRPIDWMDTAHHQQFLSPVQRSQEAHCLQKHAGHEAMLQLVLQHVRAPK